MRSFLFTFASKTFYKPSAKVMAMFLGKLAEGVDIDKDLKSVGRNGFNDLDLLDMKTDEFVQKARE